MFTKLLGITASLILGLVGIASANGSNATKFTIRVENITRPDAFTASNGVEWSLAFSPGLAVVHRATAPIFTPGKKDRGKGLEAQSEDGNPDRLAKSLQSNKGIKPVALFNTPVGAGAAGPITPGAAYEVTISAMPGDRLTLTTMMGQSKDWFYAFGESGIELFKNGKPISGDITSQMVLWDAGTEVDRHRSGSRTTTKSTQYRQSREWCSSKDYRRQALCETLMRVTIVSAEQ